MSRFLSASVLCAMVLGAPAPARAVPTITTLADAVKAPLIVIAKVRGTSPIGVELDVERVLRGSASGRLLVIPPGHVDTPRGYLPFPIGTRLVAFVGSGDVWFAAATLAAGPSLEAGVLHVQGIIECCDSSVVTPGTATLDQLASAIHGAPLAWTFRGNLVLAGPRGPTPSSIDLEVQAPGPLVRGMPAMSTFPSPVVDVGSGAAADVTVSWAAASPVRPLRLEATATGKNADGSIAVRFEVAQPGPMDEATFRRYLRDPGLGRPYYTAEISLSDGTSMTLQWGRDPGRVGELITSAGPAGLMALTMAPSRSISSPAGTLALDPPRAGLVVQHRGAGAELAQELMGGPVGCRWTTAGGAQRCTVRRFRTRFASSSSGPR